MIFFFPSPTTHDYKIRTPHRLRHDNSLIKLSNVQLANIKISKTHSRSTQTTENIAEIITRSERVHNRNNK